MRWIKCTERLPNGPRPEYENDKGVVFRKGASIMLIYRSVTNNILALLKNEPEGWEWLSEEGEDIPVEVEAAAKERYPDFVFNGVMGPVSRQREQEAVEQRREDFIAGANFRANHLGEDREGQDEWKQRFVNWFFAHKTYFPTPDKCADWFEKNVYVKDFVGDQDKLWRAVLDKVISGQILEHEEVPTDTINYLSNRYHLIKKNP